MIYIIAAIAAAVAVVELICLIMLLRQLAAFNKSLDHIASRKTNQRLTSQTPFKEANGLIDRINALLDEKESSKAGCEAESRTLKRSIAGISHDIRTPLTSLSGYLRLIEDAEDPEDVKRYLAIVNSRINDLNTLLEQLFTYTKLTDSGYEIETERVDLTPCVIDTLLAFYPQFSEKGIEPQIAADDAPAYIIGNRDALARIFQNIIKNAFDHGRENISVEYSHSGGKALFRCSNSCEHPESIDINGVFTLFYKADPARRDTSAGLGLTIAYELVRRLGGSIAVDLQGDIFSVTVTFDLN